MHNPAVSITKLDGTTEPFIPTKLFSSLTKAGAPASVAERIVQQVEGEITDGATTSSIYRHAFQLLARAERPTASRYSMKRAVFELGPSGFPFEDYLAELFRMKGFMVATRQIIRGACVSHEVDLLGEKGDQIFGAEAKFHNELGTKSDVRIALYVHSRFEDLKGQPLQNGKTIQEFWLITNTKFSADAIEYGRCSGLTLISWNYPAKGNLQDLIQETAVYPITSLTLLTRGEKQALLGRGLVLCRDLLSQSDELRALGFKEAKITAVLGEIRTLCGIRLGVE